MTTSAGLLKNSVWGKKYKGENQGGRTNYFESHISGKALQQEKKNGGKRKRGGWN